MNLCVVEQNDDAPAGLLGTWAEARGHTVHTLRAQELGAGPWPDPARFGAIVALGAEQSVHASSDPWIAPQVAFLGAAHAAAVPVLGICFGGQALAAALGGKVRRASRPEVGWLELDAAADGGGPVGRGPWLAWHADAFTVPPGARVLARSAVCPHAFRAGPSIGLQFHPEVTPAILAGWVRTGREALAATGGDGTAMVARARADADADRERAFALFDAVAAGWTDGRRSNVQR